MESYENLKRKLMKTLENRNEIPAEVMQLTLNKFNQLIDKYQTMGGYNSTIDSYINGKLNEVIATLSNGIGNEKREFQYNEIQAILSEVEGTFEEKVDGEEQKRNDNKMQDKIGEISNNGINNKMANRIEEMLTDAINEIQSKQQGLLYVRGYSDMQVEGFNDEINQFLRESKKVDEQMIFEALQKDDEELKKKLLLEYEEYISERDGKTEDKEESFRESLDAGISLEQQSEAAKAFKEREDNMTPEEKATEARRKSLADMFK